MRPIRPLVPGQPQSASETNRAFEQIRRAANPTADAGFDRFRGPMSDSLRDTRLPSMWVLITGVAQDGSGDGSGSGIIDAQPWHYTGVQVVGTNDTNGYQQLEAGAEFTNAYPLVEITKDDNVPTDGAVIVRAFPADTFAGYEFRYNPFRMEDGSGSGSPCGDNPGGIYGPLMDICCIDGTAYKLYADGTLIEL